MPTHVRSILHSKKSKQTQTSTIVFQHWQSWLKHNLTNSICAFKAQYYKKHFLMERRKAKFRNNSTAAANMENGETLLSPKHQKPNLKGDRTNILLLFFLYTLQGIPLGLSAAIPMILQNRGVSYKQQASTHDTCTPTRLRLWIAFRPNSVSSTGLSA